jgi:hypothetical protein
MGCLQLAFDARRLMQPVSAAEAAASDARPKTGLRYAEIAAWVVGLAASIILFGFRLSIFVFPIAYARSKGASWYLAIFLGLLSEGILLMIFGVLIHIIWPTPVVLMLF